MFIAFYSCESDFNFHFVDSLQLTYAQTVEAHYFRSCYVVRLLAVSFFVLFYFFKLEIKCNYIAKWQG